MDTNANSCDQIKAKFTDICAPIINQMSDKLVTNLNDVLKTSNTTFKVKKFEDKFKSDMTDKWHDEFNTIWTTKELHQRLTELNEKKKKPQQEQQQQQQQQQLQENDSTKNAWRAHGHTPEQQTQLCRNRKMTVHLMHMRELLANQSTELQKLIFEVERRRTFFNDASKRRSKILTKIDSNIEKLQHRLNNSEQ